MSREEVDDVVQDLSERTLKPVEELESKSARIMDRRDNALSILSNELSVADRRLFLSRQGLDDDLEKLSRKEFMDEDELQAILRRNIDSNKQGDEVRRLLVTMLSCAKRYGEELYYECEELEREKSLDSAKGVVESVTVVERKEDQNSVSVLHEVKSDVLEKKIVSSFSDAKDFSSLKSRRMSFVNVVKNRSPALSDEQREQLLSLIERTFREHKIRVGEHD